MQHLNFRTSLFICACLAIHTIAMAQTEKPKTGWGFGGVPAISYNTDRGYQYGIVGSAFNYGDGSSYPTYKYSFTAEWSRTTKGNGINELFFDHREFLSKKIRFTGDLGYFTNNQLPFYGFDGYKAQYSHAFENQDDAAYKSRMYYRLDRAVKKLTVDIQYKTSKEAIRVLAGIGYMGFALTTVDVDKLNKSLDSKDKLPKVVTLYEQYVAGGLIPNDERNGGDVAFVKSGIVYDTRDNEPNPNSGIWAEALMLNAPSFMNKFSFGQIGLVFRHYITLVKPRLTMANRIGYQAVIYGKKPFYLLPYLFTSFKSIEAFGGEKTVRGVLGQRVQGNGVGYGNFELRYKFLYGKLFHQDLYLSANAFLDWAMVTDAYYTGVSTALSSQLKNTSETPHWSSGMGIRAALNQNFIVAADFGRAFDEQDGANALYITLDFLY